MTRTVLLILVIGGGILLPACNESAPESDEATINSNGEAMLAVPIEDGQEMISEDDILLADRCTLCHGSERYEIAVYSMKEWDRLLDEMIAKGAVLSDKEKTALTELLAE